MSLRVADLLLPFCIQTKHKFLHENLQPLDTLTGVSSLQIFIDRNTTVFEYIINFYRTDRLFQPSHIPDELWNNECIFFKIQNPKMKIPTAEETVSIVSRVGSWELGV